MINRASLFLEALNQRVLVFDGAMGTSIHTLDLPLSDYNNLENCVEVLNLTRPDAIEQIHRSFLEVGCDAVETNTFGGMKHVLAEFDLQSQCYEIAVAAAQIAVRAVAAYSAPGRPRFVIGSMGPGTKLITLRQIDYDALLDSYYELARGLLDGGADVLLIETCQDILQTKTVIEAVRRAFDKCARRVPLMCQVTMETTGTMLVGTDIAGALTAIEAYPEVDVIGLNCATGPQEMSEHIRYLAANCTRKLSVLPNAGLPQVVNGQPHFPLSPAELAHWLREFVTVDGVNVVGGCCGTTPAHLQAVVEALHGHEPVAPSARSPRFEPACSSLYQAVPYRQDNSFLIVGERCNTNGSKKFKQLLAAEDIDGCVAMAIEQVKEEGAHVLDVCVDYVGRDGVPDMKKIVDRFAREVTAPLMLDSTQVDVLEAGLKLAGGKCIINSVNLEDGEEKLAKIARLCRQYGAAVVALTIDEDPVEAMAKTADRKLSIATRIRDLLVDRYGLREEDIFWDCLTFPITTGNEADRRLGLETLNGIEAVMRKFPRCQSILGLSNISFGLQPAARVVLNSVFLNEARQRGLTAAIVHAAKILPRNQISDERWNAALDLIYDRREQAAGNSEQAGPLERFIGLFSEGEKLGERIKIADLPLEERLKQRIIDGQKIGVDKDLDEAMRKYPPLEIINTHLLDGMKVVGDLFGSGQMQLPFVLKSAECMKAAVAYLEPFMEKTEGSSRGRIVLATVRGDVHDIGKNLVDIILSNNGYTVFNLGIKQPVNNVIAAWREHAADAIGLSGLLVKSTVVMRDDLLVMNEQNIDVPVILGGAALTRRYVEEDLRPLYHGPLHYAKDAFDGLKLMAQICEKRGSGIGVRESERPASDASGAVAKAIGGHDAIGVPSSSALEDRPLPFTREGPTTRRPEAEQAAIAARSAKNLELEIEQRYGLAEVADSEEQQSSVGGGALSAGERDIARAATNAEPAASMAGAAAFGVARSALSYDHAIPTPPFWGARVIEEVPLKAALAYINEVMLFQVQWGFRKKGRSKDDFKRYVDSEVRPIYRELAARCEREGILTPKAIYGYWPCNSDGDDLVIYEPPVTADGLAARSSGAPASSTLARESTVMRESTLVRESVLAPGAREPHPTGQIRVEGSVVGRDSHGSACERGFSHEPRQGLREIARFTFPRQKTAPHLCLADFWRPLSNSDGATGLKPTYDVVGFQIVTAGQRVSEVAREWFARNDYQQYLFLHGLGVELAEALAEYMHKQIRSELGLAGRDARELQKLFQQGYQGSRYSFGYPACPRLEDQGVLMRLLRPERIGISLSEEYQLDPEQSTSAIIAYHPAARYFNVR